MIKNSANWRVSLFRVLKICLFFLSVILVCSLFLLNIFCVSDVTRSPAEQVKFHFLPVQGLMILIALGLIAVLLSIASPKWLDRINNRNVFVLFSCFYLVIGAFLIINISPVLITDASSVHNAAKEILAGCYDSLAPGSYLSRYPHQLGLTIWDMLIYQFSPSPHANFFFNLCLVIGINYFLFRISHQLFHSNGADFFTIFLSFAFLPQLFFILFAYGTIPGLFFLTLAFYETLRFMDSSKLFHAAIAAVTGGIAVSLKSNYIIGVISILIFLTLLLLRSGNKKMIAAILIILVGISIPKTLIHHYFSEMPGAELDRGAPAVLWLTMGTDLDNRDRGPGWFNRYNSSTYNEAGYDPEKAAEIGRADLEKNLEKIKNQPAAAMNFFAFKVISQWCNPEYQSLWSGYLPDSGRSLQNSFLQRLYTGGTSYQILFLYFRLVSLAVWLLSSVYLLLFGRKHTGWELFFTCLIGGFLFHFFWEAKSQYIYPYVIILIPFCAFTLVRMIHCLYERLMILFHKAPSSDKTTISQQ